MSFRSNVLYDCRCARDAAARPDKSVIESFNIDRLLDISLVDCMRTSFALYRDRQGPAFGGVGWIHVKSRDRIDFFEIFAFSVTEAIFRGREGVCGLRSRAARQTETAMASLSARPSAISQFVLVRYRLGKPPPVSPCDRRSQGCVAGPAIVLVFACQAALTSIFFAPFCASAVFGTVTLRTPFLNDASILSASIPSGRPK